MIKDKSDCKWRVRYDLKSEADDARSPYKFNGIKAEIIRCEYCCGWHLLINEDT